MKVDEGFERRVFLFLDILGFSNLIKTQKAKLLSIMRDLVRQQSRVNSYEQSKAHSDLQVNAFSDCFIASNHPTVWAVQQLFNYASYLQGRFLWEGILTRGGIVVGDIHHSKDIVLGDAIVDAYRIESEQAFYPRVIVDETALSVFSGGTAVGMPDLIVDADKRQIVNPFIGTKLTKLDYPTGTTGSNFQLFVQPIVEKLSGIATSSSHPKYGSRYAWMANLGESLAAENWAKTSNIIGPHP